MTYYLKPPDGGVLLRVLEEGVRSRIKFLMNIHSPKPFETEGLKIEHLMENSSLDRISHFMLRLSCLFSPEFKVFFIRTETKFFEARLSSYDYSDVRKMVLTLQRHLCDTVSAADLCDSSPSVFSAIRRACTELLKRKLLKHAFKKHHGASCQDHFVIVDFQHCSSLVRRREVELRSGRCHVHCGAWEKLLICFFHNLLLHGVENLARSPMLDVVNNDVRLKSIVSLTLEKFSESYNFLNGKSLDMNTIKSKMVDKESEFFPPCALNILQTLRQDHRVGHHARIELTLYLKDIGMDVNEAIIFWKEEYSKTPDCSGQGRSSCQHAWRNNNSRYVYNIQHLYGLKGSCKNYHSKSCSALQSPGSKIEEGCPFVRMNGKDLRKVLPQMLSRYGHNESNQKNLIDQVIDLASQGKPSEACKSCFAAHCTALQIDDLVSCKELVSEDKYIKRENNSVWICESCATKRDVRVDSMCCQIGSEDIYSKVRVARTSDPSTVCADKKVRSTGMIDSNLDACNSLSSDEKYSPCSTNEITLHCPTQYYFSLKSRAKCQKNTIRLK